MDYYDGEDLFIWMVAFVLLGLVVIVGSWIVSIFGAGWLAFIIVGSEAVTAVIREVSARMDGGE